MKKALALSCVLTVAVIFSACDKTDSATTADSLYVTASSVADEAADSIVEQTSSSGTVSTALVEPNPNGSFTLSRACATTGSSAVVTETFSGTETKTLALPKVSAQFAIAVTGTQTRTWTPATGHASITCDDSAQRAAIDWTSDVAGLSLQVDVDRAIDRTKSITNKVKNVTKTKTDNVVVKGTRDIVFGASSSDGTYVTRSKLISSAVTRTRTFTDPNGVDGTITTTVATKNGANLSVTIKRKLSDASLVQKVINSGTLVATNASGAKQECTFSGVTFDMTSSTDRCKPTAGFISCDVYDSESATTKSKTLTIQFGASTDSGISISTDGGSVEDYPDYNTRGCDLEKAT